MGSSTEVGIGGSAADSLANYLCGGRALNPQELEHYILRCAREWSAERWQTPLTMEDIYLEGSDPDTQIVFVFRPANRPAECRFGWKWGTIAAFSEHLSPDAMVSVMAANFWEALDLGLPKECEGGVITWFE